MKMRHHGDIYADVASGIACEIEHAIKWERAPWWARVFGYKWRRWKPMNVESRWEYQTDRQRARQALREQFAPAPPPSYELASVPTVEPRVAGHVWNNNGVLSLSKGFARRGKAAKL